MNPTLRMMPLPSETIAEMQQRLDRTKAEVAKQTADEQKAAEPMIIETHHQEALAAASVPMYASKTSNIEVAAMLGIQFVDTTKYRSFLGIKQDKGEEVATASAGKLDQAPRDSAAMDSLPPSTETATGTRGADCPLDPRRIYEVLGEMNNSLEHLERGYFNCFHETFRATREVLADNNEIDADYVDTILKAMGKWQKDVTLMLTDMHTDDCWVWDAKGNIIDEATQDFGETCEASHIKHAAAREARQKAVLEGDEKDPVIELLDRVLVRTREVANKAIEAFQNQFKEALMPRVPTEHRPILVSNAYNTVSQFCMTIWQMVADECIMPLQHDYLTNFGLAFLLQHALEKVPSTCMRIVLPRPPEPKDNLIAFLDLIGNTSATHTPATPIVHPIVVPPVTPIVLPPAVAPLPGLPAMGGGPAPATSIPVFRGVSLTSVPAGIVTGVSLFQASLAPPPGFKTLPTSVRVTSTSSSFLTDAIQAGTLSGLDEEGNAVFDEELRKNGWGCLP